MQAFNDYVISSITSAVQNKNIFIMKPEKKFKVLPYILHYAFCASHLPDGKFRSRFSTAPTFYYTPFTHPNPLTPFSDWGQLFLGFSANEKFSPAPSAQVHLRYTFSSAPTKAQDQ